MLFGQGWSLPGRVYPRNYVHGSRFVRFGCGIMLVNFKVISVNIGKWITLLRIMTWWRHQMETFSALPAICSGNSPVTGEFPTQRPVTRSIDVFFHLRLNKQMSEQSWGWWFETLSRPRWRHCNDAAKTKQNTSEQCAYIYGIYCKTRKTIAFYKPIHCLNWCRLSVNCPGNKIHWNFNPNTKVCFQQNVNWKCPPQNGQISMC